MVIYFPVQVGRKILGSIVGHDRKIHEMYTVNKSHNIFHRIFLKSFYMKYFQAFPRTFRLLVATFGYDHRVSLGTYGLENYASKTWKKTQNWLKNSSSLCDYCGYVKI